MVVLARAAVRCQGLTHASDVACDAIALEGFCGGSRPCWCLSFLFSLSLSLEGSTHASDMVCGAIALDQEAATVPVQAKASCALCRLELETPEALLRPSAAPRCSSASGSEVVSSASAATGTNA